MGAFKQLFARNKTRFVEIVVGLGIVATLGTLLVFAVQNTRTGARRTQDL